jgi:hypothetical protein
MGQKAELVTSSFCFQTPANFALFVAQKPDQTLVSQSIQNLSRNRTWLQNAVAANSYVKTDRMSNQQKYEFVGDIFCILSFLGGHDQISPKT